MNFKSHILTFDDRIPMHNDFVELCNCGQFNYSPRNSSAYHTITTELTDEYFWLYSNYGRQNPRPEHVVNTIDGSSHENLRSAEEIEPTSQLFVLYIFASGILYISDSDMKAFVSNLLKEKLGLNSAIIKHLFVDKDEFVRQLRTVDRIRFASRERNLFSGVNSISSALRDNYHMEEPETFSICANYKAAITRSIKNTIDWLTHQQVEGNLQDLVIIGKDDQDIEQVFNSNAFTRRIEVFVTTNSQGLYDASEVKNKLIEKLGRQNA